MTVKTRDESLAGARPGRPTTFGACRRSGRGEDGAWRDSESPRGARRQRGVPALPRGGAPNAQSGRVLAPRPPDSRARARWSRAVPDRASAPAVFSRAWCRRSEAALGVSRPALAARTDVHDLLLLLHPDLGALRALPLPLLVVDVPLETLSSGLCTFDTSRVH